MSSRSWYDRHAFWVAYALAFLVIIPSIMWLAFSVQYESAYQNYAAAQAQLNTRYESYRVCFSLTEPQEALECLRVRIEPSREEQRAEEDLRAQKDMARWALALLVITFLLGGITVGVTLYGVFLVRDTLQANRDAVDVAREANRLAADSRRAWLSIEEASLTFPTELTEDYFVMTPRTRVKNLGDVPATSVEVRFQAHFFKGSEQSHSDAEASFARGLRTHPVELGQILFPQEDFTSRETRQYGKTVTGADITTRPSGERKHGGFSIFVGVTYRFVGGGDAVHISYREYAMLNVPVGTKLNEGQELSLSPMPFKSGHAD